MTFDGNTNDFGLHRNGDESAGNQAQHLKRQFAPPSSVTADDDALLKDLLTETASVANGDLAELSLNKSVLDANVATGEPGIKAVADVVRAQVGSDPDRAWKRALIQGAAVRCDDEIADRERRIAEREAAVARMPKKSRTPLDQPIQWGGKNLPHTILLIISSVAVVALTTIDLVSGSNLAMNAGMAAYEGRIAALCFTFAFVSSGFALTEFSLHSANKRERKWIMRVLRVIAAPTSLLGVLLYGVGMGSAASDASFPPPEPGITLAMLPAFGLILMAMLLIAASYFMKSAWNSLLPHEIRDNERRERALRALDDCRKEWRQFRHARAIITGTQRYLICDENLQIGDGSAALACRRRETITAQERREDEDRLFIAQRKLRRHAR